MTNLFLLENMNLSTGVAKKASDTSSGDIVYVPIKVVYNEKLSIKTRSRDQPFIMQHD